MKCKLQSREQSPYGFGSGFTLSVASVTLAARQTAAAMLMRKSAAVLLVRSATVTIGRALISFLGFGFGRCFFSFCLMLWFDWHNTAVCWEVGWFRCNVVYGRNTAFLQASAPRLFPTVSDHRTEKTVIHLFLSMISRWNIINRIHHLRTLFFSSFHEDLSTFSLFLLYRER